MDAPHFDVLFAFPKSGDNFLFIKLSFYLRASSLPHGLALGRGEVCHAAHLLIQAACILGTAQVAANAVLHSRQPGISLVMI